MNKLSVIICTHNPRGDYLRRTLDALENQTLPKDQWELLLIDNASEEPLVGKWDLSWHPNAKIFREEELGLTPARLRGIRGASGDLLVFVDDDNVLDEDYLSNCRSIARRMPWMGAFGGSNIGEFEVPPSQEIAFMLPSIAVKEVRCARWSCRPGLGSLDDVANGAGLVINSRVAQSYATKLATDPLRRSLDRTGGSLISGGDNDMALCSCELGLAVGLFPELTLTHLIPKGRLESEYLIKLAEAQSLSFYLLQYIWEGKIPEERFDQHDICRSERLFNLYRKWRTRHSVPTLRDRSNAARETGRQNAAIRLKLLALSTQQNSVESPTGVRL